MILPGDPGATVDAEVWPEGSLEVLSQVETEQLKNESIGGVHGLLGRHALIALTEGVRGDDDHADLVETLRGDGAVEAPPVQHEPRVADVVPLVPVVVVLLPQ